MYKRAGDRCEGCQRRGEAGRQDPHHVFGRSHLVPIKVAYLPESLLALCRTCHNRVDLDSDWREEMRWLSLHNLAWKWKIEAMDYSGRPLDILREWVRLGLHERD